MCNPSSPWAAPPPPLPTSAYTGMHTLVVGVVELLEGIREGLEISRGYISIQRVGSSANGDAARRVVVMRLQCPGWKGGPVGLGQGEVFVIQEKLTHSRAIAKLGR